MHHRILTIALAVLALALAASPAFGAKAPHRYSPKRGASCRRHYKRVRHGRKIYCVKRAASKKKAAPATPGAPSAPTAPAATEKAKLHSHLDPTFTRNPLNPFEVTYAYSASASQEAAPQARALGIVEEAAPLPSGVLALYSDGRLECAINVGSGVEGSECPVDYEALGQHTVTTIYTSGEQSATETETEMITPLATETLMRVNYMPLLVAEGEEVAPGTGLYHVGDLVITVAAGPGSLAAHIGCGEGSVDHLTASLCYQVNSGIEHVYGNSPSGCLQSVRITKETDWMRIDAAEEMSVKGIQEGAYHLRASVAGSEGYVGSETTTPLQFTPELSFAPDC